jgi:glutamate synthase (NADPH/NADH) large chain
MQQSRPAGFPAAQGLYDPRFEHDACGVSFVVNMKGVRSHEIVRMGIGALCNMDHRGAAGAEINTGDGAGILIQIPDTFFREVVNFDLPSVGHYATGLAFLPKADADMLEARTAINAIFESEGLDVLGWRQVPVDDSMIGSQAARVEPSFWQPFVSGTGLADTALERRVYVARKRIENALGVLNEGGVYFPSLSSQTFVYKGMLTTGQLPEFFLDLADERVDSALALVHSRFSTNTFPSWPLAHPFRYVAHNGEINTVQGNRNWMKAREALLQSDLLDGDIERIFPICTPGASDSATFDEVLELLHMGGYSLPHAVLMMIPEAWEHHASMPKAKRDFYRYHASLMEPWDGPASIAFTDGSVIGAVLDRNGLRPSRYWVTADDLVIMASEVGVIDIPSERIVSKGRLQPGRMFLVDTTAGRIIGDDEVKSGLAEQRPYGEWLDDNQVSLDSIAVSTHPLPPHEAVLHRQQVFGYTSEEVKIILDPMARSGLEPLGSMGTDTPIAVLSDRPRLLFDYFAQLFAQVTNPPLDAIREELVTALGGTLGPESNLLDPTPGSCRQLFIPQPILSNDDLRKIVTIADHSDTADFKTVVLPCLYPVTTGGEGLAKAISHVCHLASEAIAGGATILVLSDR